MFGSLDGVQFVRGSVPANATLRFSGNADVILVEPKFRGPCTLVFNNDAEHKMPATADKIRFALSDHCDVYRETNSGRVKLRSARTFNSDQVHSQKNPYASLCNTKLVEKQHELTGEFRIFVGEHEHSERMLLETSPQGRSRLSDEEVKVQAVQDELLEFDRLSEFGSGYETRFVSRLAMMRQALMERVPFPARIGTGADEKGSTTEDMKDIAQDLDALARLVPATNCTQPSAAPAR